MRARTRAGRRIGTAGLGALLGGLVGGFFVVGVTLVLKAGMDFVSGQDTWVVVVVPLLGLALAVLVLQGSAQEARAGRRDGRRQRAGGRFRPAPSGRTSPATSWTAPGEEERFPWRLAPIRTARHPGHRRLGWGDGDRGAGRVPRRGRRSVPRRSRPLVAPVAPARGPGRRRGGRGRADGDPPGRDGLHARARPAAAGAAQRRTGDGGADRWTRRLGDQRRLPPQPDPPGRAEGAAEQPRAGGGHRAVHRGDLGRHHLVSPDWRSIAPRSGRPRRSSGWRWAGRRPS